MKTICTFPFLHGFHKLNCVAQYFLVSFEEKVGFELVVCKHVGIPELVIKPHVLVRNLVLLPPHRPHLIRLTHHTREGPMSPLLCCLRGNVEQKCEVCYLVWNTWTSSKTGSPSNSKLIVAVSSRHQNSSTPHCPSHLTHVTYPGPQSSRCSRTPP